MGGRVHSLECHPKAPRMGSHAITPLVYSGAPTSLGSSQALMMQGACDAVVVYNQEMPVTPLSPV